MKKIKRILSLVLVLVLGLNQVALAVSGNDKIVTGAREKSKQAIKARNTGSSIKPTTLPFDTRYNVDIIAKQEHTGANSMMASCIVKPAVVINDGGTFYIELDTKPLTDLNGTPVDPTYMGDLEVEGFGGWYNPAKIIEHHTGSENTNQVEYTKFKKYVKEKYGNSEENPQYPKKFRFTIFPQNVETQYIKAKSYVSVMGYSPVLRLRIDWRTLRKETQTPDEVNKTALEAKITEAKGIEKGTKTQEAFDTLTNAITTAEGVRDKAGVTQAEINEAITVLGNAITAFNDSDDESGSQPINPGDLTEMKDYYVTIKAYKAGSNKAKPSTVNGALINPAVVRNEGGIVYLEIDTKPMEMIGIVAYIGDLFFDMYGYGSYTRVEAKEYHENSENDGYYNKFKKYLKDTYGTTGENPQYPKKFRTYIMPNGEDTQVLKGQVYAPAMPFGMKPEFDLEIQWNTITDTNNASADEVNKTALEAKITEAKEIEKGTKTQVAFDTLTNAITTAEGVRDKEGVTQEEINEAVTALGNAITAFNTSDDEVIEKTDKEILQELITEAQEKFDQEPQTKPNGAKYALNSPLVAGSRALNNDDAEEITQAIADLRAALEKYNNALDIADYNEKKAPVEEKIAEAEALIENSKKEASVNTTLDDAVWDAKKILRDGTVEEDINRANTLITKAIATFNEAPDAETGIKEYSIQAKYLQDGSESESMAGMAFSPNIYVKEEMGRSTYRVYYKNRIMYHGRDISFVLNSAHHMDGNNENPSTQGQNDQGGTKYPMYFEFTRDAVTENEIRIKVNVSMMSEPQILRMVFDQETKKALADTEIKPGTEMKEDLTALGQALENAKGIEKGKKTQVAFDTLKAAITTAEGVYFEPNSTQKEINDAVTALESAITAFNASDDEVVPVNKTALEAKITEAKGIEKGKKTQEAYDTLKAAITTAEGVRDKAGLTQEEINEAVTALGNAITTFNKSKDETGGSTGGTTGGSSGSSSSGSSSSNSSISVQTTTKKNEKTKEKVNINTISMEKALELSDKVVLKIDDVNLSITIDNVTRNFKSDTKPFIKNNRTMLPLRYVANALGIKVYYVESTRTAVFEKGNMKAEIQIDGNVIKISDGRMIKLDAKITNIDGRIYLPLTNISQVFGLTNGNTKDGVDNNIEWDAESRTVVIKK